MTDGKLGLRLLASGLTVACALVAVPAVQSIQRQREANAICEAASERRWDDALALSADLTSATARAQPEGRIAAECRCWALLAASRDAECTALIDEALAPEEAADWTPAPDLAKRVLRARLEADRASAAAELAERMTAAYPQDADFLQFELRARSLSDGEDAALGDLEARLDSASEPSLGLRLVLAGAYKRRGEYEAMLRVLGSEPPSLSLGLLPPWFEASAQAWAAIGRQDRVATIYDRWRALGGVPELIDALYALQLSYGGLEDPKRPVVTRLEEALSKRDRLENPVMVEALYERLIAHLLVGGQTERALQFYDEASEHFSLETITRDQIVNAGRSRETRALVASEDSGRSTRGQLVFSLPPDAALGTLWVSPDSSAPSDAVYEQLSLEPGGVVAVERTIAPTATRWVFRDVGGDTMASGSAWPATSGEARVGIQLGPPRPPDAPARLSRRPADGKRRVFVLIPDCMDWRLVQYLRTRGELPVLSELFESGYRAVLESDPPLTAAAMESLVWPERSRDITFLGLVHRIGIEIGGLASVGRNPLAFLSPLLREAANLFDTVGDGDHVAANMLFSHGGIEAGQHALVTGPHGRERRIESIRSVRPLDFEESARYPRLAGASPVYRNLIETTAAELDSAVAMAARREIDLVLLRVEPLDIVTHGKFSELTRVRQDDGQSILLDLYRYIDSRIADVANTLDADDILIVMSDHGIQTAMEHAKDAIFVAAGGDVKPGRAPGMPHLRGVSRVLAQLLGVTTTWPETGVALRLEAARSREARGPDGSRPREAETRQSFDGDLASRDRERRLLDVAERAQ